MDLAFLKFYPFPKTATDEEKIIFGRTNGYTVRNIKDCFGFGSTKITRVWTQYKQTQIIPEPLRPGPHLKLTPTVLLSNNQMISDDAHLTLNSISRKVSDDTGITISKSSIETALHKLRYHYKFPKHRLGTYRRTKDE